MANCEDFGRYGETSAARKQVGIRRVDDWGVPICFPCFLRLIQAVASTKRTRRLLASAAIPVWAISMTLVVAYLMVGHWVPLPHPEAGETLSVESRRDVVMPEVEWTAFHILNGSCPCSRRVLKHVTERDPLNGVVERIVLIEENAETLRLLVNAGYLVDCVTPAELKKKYGVESAPLLVVTDSSGTIVYAGGYTSRKQGLDFQDTRIIESVVLGNQPESLPLYGCAVSDSLKSIIDPLGFK